MDPESFVRGGFKKTLSKLLTWSSLQVESFDNVFSSILQRGE